MNNIGLYIDADNISYKYAEKLFQEIELYGNFFVKKIFADWSKTETKSWAKIIEKYGLEPIQCFRHNKKQSTDIYLITQVINDTYFLPRINHYILATSDSDFIHLCQNLKKLGKQLTIFGNDNSILKNYCDNYVSIEDNININNLEKDLIDTMEDAYIMSYTKFKKKSKVKKVSKNDLENFFEYSNKFILYQKKKGRKKYVIYLGSLKNKYNYKEEIYDDVDYINKKYKDVLKIVDLDEIANFLF